MSTTSYQVLPGSDGERYAAEVREGDGRILRAAGPLAYGQPMPTPNALRRWIEAEPDAAGMGARLAAQQPAARATCPISLANVPITRVGPAA